MLPKTLRLPSSEFRKLKKYGQTLPERDFVVSYMRSDFTAGTRFGFVIGKIITKKATQRNLIKRHLSEAVYAFAVKNSEALKEVPLYVCFIARRTILGRSYEEVDSLVNKALSAIFKL